MITISSQIMCGIQYTQQTSLYVFSSSEEPIPTITVLLDIQQERFSCFFWWMVTRL
jgi:hypothetical protein